MKTNRKNSKQQAHKLKKSAKRLAAYSAAAAATAVATGGTANATEVIHDIPDTTIGNNNGVFFDMVTGNVTPAGSTVLYNSTQGLFRVGAYFSSGFPAIYGPAGSTFAGFKGTQGFIASYFYQSQLASSSSFGNRPTAQWGAATGYVADYGNYGWFSDWDSPHGFVGIRFKLGTDTHFGWAYLGDGNGSEMSLRAFGYNDQPLARTHTTQVPEPSSMALLAMGAAGLGTWRRRRAA